MGSKDMCTPFRYEINYRNFFLLTQGSAQIKMSPPHNTRYLYPNYDYENFIIAATPDAAYASELSYYERPDPLSTANQTSWTTRYAPQLLTYGVLLEAQPFLKRPERIAEFKSFYDEAVANVAKESQRRAQDQSQTRTEA